MREGLRPFATRPLVTIPSLGTPSISCAASRRRCMRGRCAWAWALTWRVRPMSHPCRRGRTSLCTWMSWVFAKAPLRTASTLSRMRCAISLPSCIRCGANRASSPSRPSSMAALALSGRFVRMEDLSGQRVAAGTVTRVAPDGRLVLRTPEGVEVFASSGRGSYPLGVSAGRCVTCVPTAARARRDARVVSAFARMRLGRMRPTCARQRSRQRFEGVQLRPLSFLI